MTNFIGTFRATAATLVVTGLLVPQLVSAGQFGRALRPAGGTQNTAASKGIGNMSFSARNKLTNSGIIVVGGKDGAMRQGAKLGNSVSLNPQPLPPKTNGLKLRRLGDKVGLNPQPLPPKDGGRLFNKLKSNAQVIAAPNGNTGINGTGLPKSWQKAQVIAAPNGNTGVTGAGLPKGKQLSSSAARLGSQPAQPQQLMSLGLPAIVVAGAAKELLPSVGEIGEAALTEIGNIGNNKLPPAPADSNGKGKFEGSITAQADPPATLGKRKLSSIKGKFDPNAEHTLGKRKLSSIKGKFDPNASTSIDKVIDQVSKTPAGGGASGGAAPSNPPPPSAPAPQTPAQPGPGSQGPVQIGGGFPWQDLVAGSAMRLASRRVVQAPLEVVAAPVVEAQPVVVEPQAMSAAQSIQVAGDLVLEDVQFVEGATLLAGPAYRVKFRNQSVQAVGPFRVAIFAGIDGNVSDDAPRALVEVAGMRGSEVMEATLRLPARAMKLISAKPNQPAGFSHLFVAIDSTEAIAELDEENNTAVIDVKALEVVAAR